MKPSAHKAPKPSAKAASEPSFFERYKGWITAVCVVVLAVVGVMLFNGRDDGEIPPLPKPPVDTVSVSDAQEQKHREAELANQQQHEIDTAEQARLTEERRKQEKETEQALLEEEQRKQEKAAKPKPTTGTINWVDLGLSVKWATCNVGASSLTAYGDYFAWGETTTKSAYTEQNSKTFDKEIGDIAGNPQYDAARANWGGSWRMPTQAEMQELIDKCTWTWTTQGGHNGYKVTSKTNGNSIFLPASGFREGSSFESPWDGCYWCSTPNDSYSQSARVLFFDRSDHTTNAHGPHYAGMSVRPVSE